MHTAFTAIGQTKGRPRLWLEGVRLAAAHFEPGARFRAIADAAARSLRLVLDDRAGDRTVSSRERSGRVLPIVDVAGATIHSLFGEDARVQVVYRSREIVISLPPLAVARQRRETAVRDRLAAGDPLRVGSIFSGAGVMDHAVHAGLNAGGIETVPVLALERDPRGLEVVIATNPATAGIAVTIEGSVDEIDAATLPQLDVLIAGIPCVAASLAGRAKKKIEHPEADPEAGHLVAPLLMSLRATNPAAAVFECVKPWANTASASILRTQLSKWGYRLFEVDLDGSTHGAIENRKRWSLVAISEGLAPDTFKVMMTAAPAVRQCLGDVLEEVPLDSPLWMRDAGLEEKAARALAAGHNFKEQLVRPEAVSVGVIGAGYSRRRPSEPRLHHPVNPDLKRLLTPSEHAAVKALPAELAAAVISGRSASEAHRLLGQSVIWPCFRNLANALARCLQAHASAQRRPSSNVTLFRARRRPPESSLVTGRQLQLAL